MMNPKFSEEFYLCSSSKFENKLFNQSNDCFFTRPQKFIDFF